MGSLVPDSQSDDDRRADRGILARDRRSSDATETDPDTADAETSDADTEGTGTTASGTDSGAADTEKPEGSGADDDATAAKPARAISRRDRSKATPDPITDMAAREREAGVDELFPFGRPGRPLTRSHPFVFGFYGALGVLVAYMLVQALTNALQVIILIIVALFLAVGLNPGVEALERLGISRRWAVLLVFLALVGFFVGFGFAIVPPLSQQTSAIIHNLTSGNGYLEQLQNNPRLQDLDHRYHLLQKARTALQSKDLGTRAANGAVGVGQVVLSCPTSPASCTGWRRAHGGRGWPCSATRSSSGSAGTSPATCSSRSSPG
jgi:hypothetical protein